MPLLERIVSSSSNTYVAATREAAVAEVLANAGTLASSEIRHLVWPALQPYTNDNATFLNYNPAADQNPEYLWNPPVQSGQQYGFAVLSGAYLSTVETYFDIQTAVFCDNAHQMQVDLVNADTGVIISTAPLGVLLQDGSMDPLASSTTDRFKPYNWQNIRYYTISTGNLPAGNYRILISFTALNYNKSKPTILNNPAGLSFVADIMGPIPIATGVYNRTQGTYYSTMDDAVAGASSGDDLLLLQGTYTRSTTLFINKSITFEGAAGSMILLTAPVIPIVAVGSNITLKNLRMTSDAPYENEFIQIGGSNNQVLNNTIYGPPQQLPMMNWVVNRAVVPQANNMTNLLVQGNMFYSLRSGMYLNPGTNGNIINNVVYNTKGGFLVDSAVFVMNGNSWGIPANEVDIAIFAGTPVGPPYDPISQLKANNNNATVSDQRV